MNGKTTPHDQNTPQMVADNAILAYRSYRPRPTDRVIRILYEFFELWEAAHEHGISGLDGIHHLISLLPMDWVPWAIWLSSSYIYRVFNNPELEGDFRGFITFIFLQYVHYRDTPTFCPDDLPPPPLQWCGSIIPDDAPQGQYDHEAGPSHRHGRDLLPGYDVPQGVHQFSHPEHDPTRWGEAPMIVAPDNDEYPIEYQADDEAAPLMRSPNEHRQFLGLPDGQPPPDELDTEWDRWAADMRRWLAYFEDGLTIVRDEIHREVLEVPDVAIPHPVPEVLPGGAADDPIEISSDDGFEGSSGLSSLDSDGDW